MRRTRTLVAMLAASTLLMTACGSEDAAQTSAGASDASSAAEGSESAEAQAWVEENTDNPTQIALDVPLSKKPEAGNHVVRLLTPIPVAVLADEQSREAAKALGWKYTTINVERGAEGIQRAFSSALALKPEPDAIILSGFPAATYAEQLAEAKKRGIKVVANSVTDEPRTPTTPDAVITGTPQVQKWGKDVAAYVAANSKGSGNVAVFNISAFGVLVEFEKAFTEALAEWCPDCKVRSVDQQLTDIGTTTPQSVVSEFQRDPDLEWAVFGQGDVAIGVPAALQSAGMADKVRVVGESANEANLEALKTGDEEAWTGYASPYLGWAAIDAAARLIVGDDVTPAEEAFAPSQIITQENVEQVVTSDKGYYIGVEDYPAQFKKLWQVG